MGAWATWGSNFVACEEYSPGEVWSYRIITALLWLWLGLGVGLALIACAGCIVSVFMLFGLLVL